MSLPFSFSKPFQLVRTKNVFRENSCHSVWFVELLDETWMPLVATGILWNTPHSCLAAKMIFSTMNQRQCSGTSGCVLETWSVRRAAEVPCILNKVCCGGPQCSRAHVDMTHLNGTRQLPPSSYSIHGTRAFSIPNWRQITPEFKKRCYITYEPTLKIIIAITVLIDIIYMD
jgi:hypothetical protein